MQDTDLKRRKIIKIAGGSLLLAVAAAGGFSLARGKCASINYKKCIGCGACMRVCPHNAISYQGINIAIDKTKCTGCGRCKEICRHGAINL